MRDKVARLKEVQQRVTFDAELGQSLDELLEVDLSVAVSVQDVNDSVNELVLRDVWQGDELFDRQRARVVFVQLLETHAQPHDLLPGESLAHVLGR